MKFVNFISKNIIPIWLSLIGFTGLIYGTRFLISQTYIFFSNSTIKNIPIGSNIPINNTPELYSIQGIFVPQFIILLTVTMAAISFIIALFFPKNKLIFDYGIYMIVIAVLTAVSSSVISLLCSFFFIINAILFYQYSKKIDESQKLYPMTSLIAVIASIFTLFATTAGKDTVIMNAMLMSGIFIMFAGIVNIAVAYRMFLNLQENNDLQN